MPERYELDRIRADRTALVDALKSAGATMKGGAVACPFHDDQHASGSIHGSTDSGFQFSCHGCGFSSDVFGVVQRAQGIGFLEVCQRFGLSRNGNGDSHCATAHNGKPTAARVETPAPTPEALERQAAAAQQRLQNDLAALDHLLRTRGINAATATRFGLGITGDDGERFWTMPIRDGDRLIAIKHHRADGQKQKSFWVPKGVSRDQVFPVCIDAPGPVWVCPGELKALAVAGVGRAAIGITSGEGAKGKPNDLPASAIELLKKLKRSAALPPDDDQTGGEWVEHVRQQLTEASIDARTVDLGLDASVGVKDIGDFVTRALIEDARESEAVAATLDDRYARSDPWHGKRIGELWASGRMWKPVTIVRTGLPKLDETLGGGLRTRGAHLFVGKAGQAKSQLAITIAVNAAALGTPSAILSLELGADEVGQIVAAQLADIPRRSLAVGRVSGECGERLSAMQARYADLPLYVLDDEDWPDGLERDAAARLIAEGVRRFGWRAVVLDYLGLLRSPESDRSDYTTDILNSSVLRRIARKNDIALIVVAALRKSSTFKPTAGNAISLDDVAGAGRLVYDAQSVLLVSAEHGDADSGIVHVRPLKLRFAPLIDGTDVQLRWRPKCAAITDMECASESAGAAT